LYLTHCIAPITENQMSVHHATARKLATEAEWTLLQASRAGAITALTPAQLSQKIDRTRKLRDKYRDLAQQQRGEARGKRTAKSTRAAQGNDNTIVKQQMFDEALERFEEQLAKVTTKTTTTAKPKPKAKASATTKAKARKTVATKAVAKPRRNAAASSPPAASGAHIWGPEALANATAKQAQSEESRGTRKAQKLNHQSAEAHQGHVSSRGRHNQAKRDGR
jgi:hypothetical protein